AFRALRDFELDFLTFFKRLEAVHLDCGEVRKQIFTAVIRGDKAEAFRVVEPLDGTCCHKKRLSILTNHTSRKSKKPRVTLPPLKTCSFILIKCVAAHLSIVVSVPSKILKVKTICRRHTYYLDAFESTSL